GTKRRDGCRSATRFKIVVEASSAQTRRGDVAVPPLFAATLARQPAAERRRPATSGKLRSSRTVDADRGSPRLHRFKEFQPCVPGVEEQAARPELPFEEDDLEVEPGPQRCDLLQVLQWEVAAPNTNNRQPPKRPVGKRKGVSLDRDSTPF